MAAIETVGMSFSAVVRNNDGDILQILQDFIRELVERVPDQLLEVEAGVRRIEAVSGAP